MSHATSDLYQRYMNLSSVGAVEPLIVDHARGAVIWDEDGKQYVDCFGGIAVVNAGHCDPRILEAAREQMRRVVHCGSLLYHIPVVGQAAQRLAEVTPGRLQKTFFCNSGAEAVEGAMRLAKAFTGRTEFIALAGGFHGRTNATLGVTGNRKRKQRGGPYSGVAFAPAPNPYRCRLCSGTCDLSCAEAVRDVIDYQTADNVAAFIAEPVMGEGGIIVPHHDYFQHVKAILDEREILLIADEVQTGFGRTGKLFGVEHFEVEPDIMTMAKGIADGFPLAGFIARPEIADSFRAGEHLSTFGGNPVCCAAALANLRVITEDALVERSAALGSQLLEQLRDFAARHPQVGDVRGLGLMIGMELVSSRTTKAPIPQLADQIRAASRERGVLIGVGGFYGNVIRLQPPLVITQEQLGFVVEVLDDAFAAAV